MSQKELPFVYLVLLLVLGTSAKAQQYNFRNYSVKDGIAQSQVYSLLQDSRGYLWMGTRGGGITRYDGTNFKTFTVRDGLSNNYVFCIREDRQHNLWIGTNSGLSFYNGIQFKTFRPLGDSVAVSVQEIAFDKKGRKWLATSQGVLLMQGDSIIRVSQLLKDQSLFVNTIFADASGLIWYGTAQGLSVVEETAKGFMKTKFARNSPVMNDAITVIKQHVDGRIWIGTYGNGLYVYDGSRFYRIDEQFELYKRSVFDIYFDNQNNVWLATLSNGVVAYNLLAKSFTWLGEKEGLSNNHVRCIWQDRSGNYWFGTSGGGVCNYIGKQFTVYDKSAGLSGNFIYSIYRDSKKRLWVGTSEKGVSVLDSGRFIGYGAANGFLDVKVKSIIEDEAGLIYLGTEDRGLFVFDGLNFISVDALGRKLIRSMVKDKDGNLYLATGGNGLYQLIKNGNQFLVKNFTTKDGLLSNRITCLHYDKKGQLWYGTENNGIGLWLNDKPGEIFGMRNGLPSLSIRSFAEDAKGFLWIGTAGNGIASVPLYQNKYVISSYDHRQGLTSSNVYLLTTDAFQNLFVGSETGLDYITLNAARKPVTIKHFSKGEGFTGIETCLNSVYNDSNGTIWFGTINGLTKYDPANQVKNTTEPVTSITNIKLFYEGIANTIYKKYVGDWNQINNLTLPYNQNHLTFDFMGINFSNAEAVLYQWKLEGFDQEWSPPSQQRTVTYPNISHGDYRFLVRACNEDGVWNKVPVAFHFQITPPFWLLWWVIALFALVLIASVYLVFRWRVSVIRKKALVKQQQIQLEKEVVELEQKALRLQMNPHFIFNALNSIQSQIGTDNEQTARYYLAKFSRLMRQILDHSRTSSISLQEDINTLENYLLIEKFCNGDRFDYVIKVDPDMETDYIKIPPMLLQPFIENAIKHGLKSMNDRRGMITLKISEQHGLLECAVIDNGIGRAKSSELNKNSKETYHTSTALAVTQERLALFNMNKDIIPLEIIDLYDDNGKPSGTKVIMRLPIN